MGKRSLRAEVAARRRALERAEPIAAVEARMTLAYALSALTRAREASRTPRRPACRTCRPGRRPRARRHTASSTRAGPDDDSGSSEPPGHLARRRAHRSRA